MQESKEKYVVLKTKYISDWTKTQEHYGHRIRLNLTGERAFDLIKIKSENIFLPK